MNIEDYIASGILEDFILGNLSEEENRQVIQMSLKYPEIKQELDIVETTFQQYAESHSKVPPLALKDKILKQIIVNDSDNVIPITSKKSAAKNSVRSHSISQLYLVAASLSLAVVSSLAAFFYYHKWSEAEVKLTTLTLQITRTAQNLNFVKQDLQRKNLSIGTLEKDLSLLLDTNFRKVPLNGLKNAPTSLAIVLWNTASKEVFIHVKNLPVPPPGKQYQLWAMDSGKPVDAGVFNVADTEALQKVKNISSAQAFAVTLEKLGGSPNPTLEQLYLLGAI